MTTPRTPRTSTAKPASQTGHVDFDMDQLEVESDEPCYIRFAGRRIKLNSIRDLDWKVSAALSPERPHQFFKAIVAEEDQEFFLKQPLTGKKLNELMEFYWEFYGITPGESNA